MPPSHRRQTGAALLLSIIVTLVASGLAAAFLTISIAQTRTSGRAKAGEIALTVAEAGIDHTLYTMNNWVAGTAAIGAVTGSVGGSTYTVAIIPPFAGVGGTYTLRASCSGADARRAIEATVSATVEGLPGSIGGERGIRLDSNAKIDSYDSALGTYSSQAVNGSGSNQHALSTGTVVSNGNVQGYSNMKIWGSVRAGGAVTTPNGSIAGTLQQYATPFTLPPVVIPAAVSALPAAGKSVNSNQTLNPGDYHWTTFNMSSNAKLTIKGPSRIVIEGNANASSNTKIHIDSTGGPVEFYFKAGVTFNSNTEIRSLNYRPADVRINITTDNYTANPNSWSGSSPAVELDSNAEVYAMVYAPNAILNLDSNGHIYGAVMAKKLAMNSNATVHEDRSASWNGAAGNYRVAAWRQIVQ